MNFGTSWYDSKNIISMTRKPPDYLGSETYWFQNILKQKILFRHTII